MMKHAIPYIEKLKEKVYEKISVEINDMTNNSVVKDDLGFHFVNKASANFQDFYFQTLSNETHFISTPDFFRKFKKRYGLQGINNGYLDGLESRKGEIIDYIRRDKLIELYFEFFNKAAVKHKDTTIEMDLGSFFAKLVHTFRAADYCALDNPIKNYFKLGKESFFIAFIVISEAYKQWAKDNQNILRSLRKSFEQLDKDNKFLHDKITNLKLLDLIFWIKADRQKKEKAVNKKQKRLKG